MSAALALPAEAYAFFPSPVVKVHEPEDAFGVLIFRAGTTANRYLYCGEKLDEDLGLYYNRARYLNADSGRFWSMDSYEGSSSDPMSLHKYLYAHADPVGMIDPSGHISIIETQAVLFNIGIRMIPVATKISFFVAEAAGVSTIGYGAARGAVALGTAAERALPPGVSVGGLFSAAIQLPKGIVLGAHRFVKQAISGTGMQSNHLNQTAAFPAAVFDDALTISFQGSTATKGSQHYNFHRALEEFWSKFRSGPLSFRPPTNAEYDDALREALAAADVPAGALEQLVSLARASRRAAGYFDDAGGLPPNVPNPIPGVP
ncbi:MAG: RHS repeat-associated core domain-containing protein [Opitutaceae bacterium]